MMTQIDRSKPVLVTGATGYVAGWLVKKLLEEGFTVHAAVRNPNASDKLKYLNKLAASSPGEIKYFKSNLLEKGSYEEAMQGCEVVFHTASPFTVTVSDPEKELLEPAVKGTRNVLETANQVESVKRVVLTSSCAAIYGDNIDFKNTGEGIFTEEHWNTTSSLKHNAYSYSKTLAEKEAWKIAGEQTRWELVVINPILVLGPAINPKGVTSESFHLMKMMGDGTLKMGVPPMGWGIVDVRDVAEAHFRAAFTSQARGRYLVSGHNTSYLEMAKILAERFGNRYPIPRRELPKWLLWLVGPMVDKAITRTFVARNFGYPWKGDNSKSRRELGLEYRPLSETICDMFEQLIEAGELPKK